MDTTCPYCGKSIHLATNRVEVYSNQRSGFSRSHGVEGADCPSCHNPILFYSLASRYNGQGWENKAPERIWPKKSQKRQVSRFVPQEIVQLFDEAAAVLEVSPRASAALSRRCLQQVIEQHHKILRRNLVEEIEELSKLPNMPSTLVAMLDPIRSYGSFAAHPIQEVSSGAIVPVEQGEAEWLLHLLEELFDLTFVKPAIHAERVAELERKKQAAGKR